MAAKLLAKLGRYPNRYFAGGLLLAVLLLYGPALGFGYVWDDEIIILKNADLQRQELSWALLGRPVLADSSYFRPLVFLSWWLEFRALGALSPVLSHGVNLGLFYLTLLLVYRLLQQLLPGSPQQRQAWAALGTLLYLCHPVQLEQAVWISGRFDLLANLFLLAALLLFLQFPRAPLAGAAILLCGLGALGAKETGLLLLPLLYCLQLWRQWPERRPGWRAAWHAEWRLWLALLLLDGIYLWLRSAYGSGLYHRSLDWAYIRDYYGQRQVPLLAWAEYLRYGLWPFSRHLITPLEFIGSQSGTLAGALLLTGASGGLLLLAWRRRWRSLPLLLAYGLSLVLVLHLLPLDALENLRQDRYLGLALVFLITLLLGGAQWLYGRWPRPTAVALLLYGLSWLMVSAGHLRWWRSDEALYGQMNRYYLPLSGGISHKGYFLNLLKQPGHRALARLLLANDDWLSRRYQRSSDIDRHYNLAIYLLNGHQDPAGIKILEEILPLLATAPGVPVQKLENSYLLLANGRLLLKHDLAGADAALADLLARNPQQPLGLKLSLVIATLRGDGAAQATLTSRLRAQNLSPGEWQQLEQLVAELCAQRRFPGCPKDLPSAGQ